LAILALHLGDSLRAVELCVLAADPTPRTVFEETLARWHGDLGELIGIVDRIGNGPLRASFALGVGRASPQGLAEPERSAVVDTLTRWFKDSPDTGTHGATDWALRQWSGKLPKLDANETPAKERDWYLNSLGKTMLKIPPGKFRMGAGDNAVDVELTRAFFLADREVSVGEFQQFFDDPDTAASEKPAQKNSSINRNSHGLRAPICKVTWFDAVLFCNWLSRREQREICYRREGEKNEWKLVPSAKGYRLPTSAEWEYACRAGSTTDFHFGNEDSRRHDYCVGSGRYRLTNECGSKIPNPYGVFDLYGNVWEWCHDQYDERLPGGVDPSVDSAQGNADRIIRGGGVGDDNSSDSYWSAGSGCLSPNNTTDYIVGFRFCMTE
jgi:formylglycine-generating enzyme required for sulfatase activity